MKLHRFAFTMIELLVVLGLIALLLALSLPAIQRTRDVALRSRCQSNLRQLGLAAHSYHDRAGQLPPGSLMPASEVAQHSTWICLLLPDVGEEARWNEAVAAYRANPNFESAPHGQFRTSFSLVQCPSDGRGLQSQFQGKTVGLSAYLGNGGRRMFDGVFAFSLPIKFAAVSDGLSNTLLAGERPTPDYFEGNWYAGRGELGLGLRVSFLYTHDLAAYDYPHSDCPVPAYFGPSNTRSPCSARHWWSFHAGGANFLFCDGSARMLSYQIDRELLQAMASRNGGEVVADAP